jgi:hypothetical protein
MGYRGPLFRGFPFRTTHWFRANVSLEELGSVRFVAAGVWPVLSGGTGNLADVVRRSFAGELIFPAESEEAKTIEIIEISPKNWTSVMFVRGGDQFSLLRLLTRSRWSRWRATKG